MNSAFRACKLASSEVIGKCLLINSKFQQVPGQPMGFDCRPCPGRGSGVWRILALPRWGGEFEPIVSKLSYGLHVFYLLIGR